MHPLFRALAALALGSATLGALASKVLPPPADLPPGWRPPAVFVPTPGQQPIQLRAARVRSTIAAGQAQTEVELVLFNPNHRVLEGELQFPLLEGQVVTGFALDVNGKLRDAVPVPKAQGQEIFEDIRRRRVDPGLLEATAGNQYKLRVYPIMGRGERRVAITVTETLPRHAAGALLRLPLAFGGTVGALDLRVSVAGAQPRDVTVVGGPAGIAPTATQDGVELRFTQSGWDAPTGAAGWLRVAVRQPERPQLMAGESAGGRWFAGQLPLRDEPVRRPDARHVALVWDASASSAQQLRVLPVLDAWFRAQRAPVKVSLLVVRNRPEPVREFTIAPDGFAALADVLRREPLDGSSNFDDLPVPANVDATLLVSDGLATDGQRRIGYRASAPLFAINASTAADVPRLTRLAERTGGAFVDAATLAPRDAVRAMLFHGWRITQLRSIAADQLASPSMVVRDGRLSVGGRITAEEGFVEVALAHPDGRRKTIKAALPRQANARRWPGQLWAQWRGSELADEPAVHAGELKRIAAEHGVVGPNSSLIVLELATDYARYELPAPPDLAEEVGRLRQQQFAQARASQHAHLESMVRQFEERQRWWDREFPKEMPAKQEQPAQGALGERARFEGKGQSLAIAPPSAPAPTTAARPAPAAAPSAPAAEARPAPAAPAAAMKSLREANVLARQDKEAREAPGEPASRIALQAFTPDSLAMRRLADAPDAQLYATYLDERREQAASSAFYLDAAGLLFRRGQDSLALRVLSNLAEMNLENRQLLRLYAYRLVQARQHVQAVPVFERVAALAPNEPQSWRDLALAQAEAGQPQRAVEHLWHVVSRPWHGRFAGMPMIALAELNALAAQAQAAGRPLDLTRVDPRLQRNLPLGLRVVMAWDLDDTDIDLWVTDPNGDAANYSRRLTFQGGAMSPDATGGYGPEEFALKDPKPGRYLIQAKFYGHQQQVLAGGTTVMVRVTTGFGTREARDEWITLRLGGSGEMVRVGEVEVR